MSMEGSGRKFKAKVGPAWERGGVDLGIGYFNWLAAPRWGF